MSKSDTLKLKGRLDILPIVVSERDVYAIKNLQKGEASPEQQQRALKFIIEQLCGAYNMSFSASDPRLTDFNEGRRFVANKIIEHTNISSEAIKKMIEDNKKGA